MNKRLIPLLSSACCLLPALASIHHHWTVNVDSSIPEPYSIHAYHGETIYMEATLKSYGQPMTAPSTARFLWQTNGMGNAWWQTNATCSAGVVRARFTPAMDPGANAVTFFLEVTDSDGAAFRPNGKIILSRSPGTNPETADLPPPGGTIDFARVTYINAPWCTLEAAEAAVESGVQRSLNAVENLSNAVNQTYAKLSDIPEVPSIAGLATTGEVAAAAASVLLAAEQSAASTYQPLAGMADYARLSDLPTDYITPTNLVGYATKGYADDAANAARSAAEASAATNYQPLAGMADYARLSDLPTDYITPTNLVGYATKGYADDAADAARAAAEASAATNYQPIVGMSDYARLSDLPTDYITPTNLVGYATKGYADDAANAACAAAEASAATNYQPIVGMADYARLSDLPTDYLTETNLVGYATKGYADDAANAARAAAEASAATNYQPLAGMSDYARLSDLPTDYLTESNLVGYATKGYADDAANAARAAAEASAATNYQPLAGMSDYARLSDLPTDYLTESNLVGYATKGYADDAANAARAAAESSAASTYQPLAGMADYARLSDIPEVPSLDGYATKSYVEYAVTAAVIGTGSEDFAIRLLSPDGSTYQTADGSVYQITIAPAETNWIDVAWPTMPMKYQGNNTWADDHDTLRWREVDNTWELSDNLYGIFEANPAEGLQATNITLHSIEITVTDKVFARIIVDAHPVTNKINQVIYTDTLAEATNATLAAANAYTDAHSGGGSGGVDTNAVIDITTPMIASATNDLNTTLTNAISMKRDLADLDVYAINSTNGWTFTYTKDGLPYVPVSPMFEYRQPKWCETLEDLKSMDSIPPEYADDYWEGPGWYLYAAEGYVLVSSEREPIGTIEIPDEDMGAGYILYELHLTYNVKGRIVRVPDRLATTNDLFATVRSATNDLNTTLNDTISKKADEFTQWECFSLDEMMVVEWVTNGWFFVYGDKSYSDLLSTNKNAVFLQGYNGDTATRKRVLRTGEAATPQELTNAISTNNPAFVSAVLATGLNIDTTDVAALNRTNMNDYADDEAKTNGSLVGRVWQLEHGSGAEPWDLEITGAFPIPSGAYCGAYNLRSVTAPNTNSDVTVAAYAFAYLPNLETVTLGKCTSLNNNAFVGSNLRHIIISNGLATISAVAGNPWLHADSLEEIDVPCATTISTYGFDGYWTADKVRVIRAPNVITIGNGAFRNQEELEYVDIRSATNINGSGAFSNCGKLKRIDFSPNLKKLGDNLSGCYALDELILPGCTNLYATQFGATNAVLTSCEKILFSKNSRITYLSLPNCREILDSAFFSDTVLTAVTNLDNVVTMGGNGTFYYCSALRYVGPLSSLTEITTGASQMWSRVNNCIIDFGTQTKEQVEGISGFTWLPSGNGSNANTIRCAGVDYYRSGDVLIEK